MDKELQKELEEISSVLSSLPKETIEAPEGYFESFSDRMLVRIKTEQQSSAKSIVRPIQKYTKYLVAAMILVFMGLSIYLFQVKQTTTINNVAVTILNEEDIYLEELDEASLIEYVNLNSNNKVDVKADVDEYQNYIDEQTIIEEL